MGGRRAGKAAPFGLRGLAEASADVSGSAREAADARGPCIVRERPRTGGLRPTRDRLRLDGWPGLRRLDSTVVRERTVIRMSPAPPHHLPWRAREDQAPLTHAHGGSRRKTAKASGGGRRGPVAGGTGHFAPYRASRGSDGQADETRINQAKPSPLSRPLSPFRLVSAGSKVKSPQTVLNSAFLSSNAHNLRCIRKE